ncbi:hypothetical protein A6A26_18740 [Pantoea sp. OXWO6B1]|nr:hypothetical protein A6A26_18740 [Pantoea sp. OXWO6B1]
MPALFSKATAHYSKIRTLPLAATCWRHFGLLSPQRHLAVMFVSHNAVSLRSNEIDLITDKRG